MTYYDEVELYEDIHSIKIARLLSGYYPWPICSIVSQREFVASSIGASCLGKDNGTGRNSFMIIVYHPPESDVERLNIPPPGPGIVRSLLGTCVIEMVPLSKDSCHVTMVGYVDPMLPTYIPNWLYLMAAKMMGKKIFEVNFIKHTIHTIINTINNE